MMEESQRIPDYIRMIKEGKDFFIASAAIMLDKNYEEVTRKERTLAKRLLLWTLCGSKATLELILSDREGEELRSE